MLVKGTCPPFIAITSFSGTGFPPWNGFDVFMSVPEPIYSNECELVIIRLNLTNLIGIPVVIGNGMNSLNVTVVMPVTAAVSVASLTVNNIGSVITWNVALPLDITVDKFCVGKKFRPLLITSTEVIVPAILTFGENSGRIASGPCGSSFNVITGGYVGK